MAKNMKNDKLQKEVNAYVNGVKTDTNKLFHEISKACLSSARKLLHQHSAKKLYAEDITQDVCLKLWNGGLKKYNPASGGFDGWLYRVLQNHFVSLTRKRSFKDEESYDTWESDRKEIKLKEFESNHTDENDVDELYREVMDKMDVLTDIERDVLTKTQLEGMSMKEMGSEYDKDGNWASGVKHRAAKKIRKALGCRGWME